jgi:hypothetical protein
MVNLYGQKLSRTRLAERTGALSQVAGVELLELGDGPERGVRVLHFRTGAGLSFQVAVDRGFDLLGADWRGVPIGWRSPTGPRHPSLGSPEENAGWGFLRSFTGLLATCGLDQALAPASSSAERYIYPGFDRHDYPLHGRISQIPARLLAYGERWQGERCTLFAEAEVAQTAVFGENLVLHRRIEAELGGTTIAIRTGSRTVAFGQPRTCCYTTSTSAGRCWMRAASSWRRSARSCTPSTRCATRVPAIARRDRHRPTSASRSTSTTWSPARTAWLLLC